MKIIIDSNFPENALTVAKHFDKVYPNNIGKYDFVEFGSWGKNDGFYAYRTNKGNIVVKDIK